jgi:hypothetical protein
MEWYKWAFDGVGGAAAVALCARLLRRWAKRTKLGHAAGVIQSAQVANISAPVGSSQIAMGTNISQTFEHHHHHYQPDCGAPLLRNSEPTPEQIWNDLGGVVPFDRVHAKEKYVGIPVLWKLRFSGVSEITLEKQCWLIHTYFVPDSKDEPEWNIVTFRMTEVPTLLKAAPWSSVLWVRGTISSLDSSVSLKQNPEIVKVERPIAVPLQPGVDQSESIGDKTP